MQHGLDDAADLSVLDHADGFHCAAFDAGEGRSGLRTHEREFSGQLVKLFAGVAPGIVVVIHDKRRERTGLEHVHAVYSVAVDSAGGAVDVHSQLVGAEGNHAVLRAQRPCGLLLQQFHAALKAVHGRWCELSGKNDALTPVNIEIGLLVFDLTGNGSVILIDLRE